MRRAGSSLAIILVLLLVCGSELRAGDAVPALSPKIRCIWEQDYATGDWSGFRSSLEERGVRFNITYAADGFGVVAGGIKRGTLYNGLLDIGTDVDLEKLIRWKGAHFHISMRVSRPT